MSLLLDTQALLWFILDDTRLSKKAQESIVAPDVLIYVSPASLWEIAIKISLGKYALPASFAAFWDEQFKTNDFSLLPITVSHTARVVDLPFHHRDPFDRLIIAQSLEEGIPVVSNDDMFDHYGVGSGMVKSWKLEVRIADALCQDMCPTFEKTIGTHIWYRPRSFYLDVTCFCFDRLKDKYLNLLLYDLFVNV
jgi:PIN domain nuclease of toxin-antitoxin system